MTLFARSETTQYNRSHLFLNFAAIIILFSILLCTQKAPPPPPAPINEQIEALPGITFEEITGDTFFEKTYKITVTQPISHDKPELGTFEQKIFLSHKGFDRPTVMITEGYTAHEFYLSEPARLLLANQVIVEHRFFGESIPQPLDWSHLNVKSSAADHHAIITLLKSIYKDKWVTSGISKGGQTSMYHRYFYPNDVTASIPYVGPLNFSNKEPRITSFLENVGNEKCRAKIHEFQIDILKRKKEIMPEFKKIAKQNKYVFSIGLEKALEYAVLEYPVAFWQWGYLSCEDIPAAGSPAIEMISHLQAADAISFFTDDAFETFQAFFYQALTEIGFYTYDISGFKGLITAINEPDFSMSAPKGTPLVYSNKTMLKVNDFLQQKASNTIYIYGEYDPWTASAVEVPEGKTNSFKMVYPSGSHRTRIYTFNNQDQKRMVDSLSIWLDDTVFVKNWELMNN